MSMGIVVMGVIILLAFATVVAVMYYGSREDVSTHGLRAADSRAVQAWQARAEAAMKRAEKLEESAEEADHPAEAAADEAAAAEARREAALARKAARAAKQQAES